MQLQDSLNREWVDISSEKYRRYVFPDGVVEIVEPLNLHVSESGGHRVFNGRSWYIPPTWIAIEWEAKDGQPHFVK